MDQEAVDLSELIDSLRNATRKIEELTRRLEHVTHNINSNVNEGETNGRSKNVFD